MWGQTKKSAFPWEAVSVIHGWFRAGEGLPAASGKGAESPRCPHTSGLRARHSVEAALRYWEWGSRKCLDPMENAVSTRVTPPTRLQRDFHSSMVLWWISHPTHPDGLPVLACLLSHHHPKPIVPLCIRLWLWLPPTCIPVP